MDMSGNVWEWVKTESKSSHVVKGGGWTSYKNQSKISFRNSVDAKLKTQPSASAAPVASTA